MSVMLSQKLCTPARTARSKVTFAICIGVLILAVPLSVSAYEFDVHFALTMYLAELAGFPREQAFEIAKYDQATDDDPMTEPLGKTPAGIGRRARHHFMDLKGPRFAELKTAAFSCKGGLTTDQYKRIGHLLHALEDYYAHKGFDPMFGHALYGHTPDKPWNKPSELPKMVEDKFNHLLQLRACTNPTKSLEQAQQDFSRVATRLQNWALQELPAGVGGDNDSPSRWEALLTDLYGNDNQLYRQTAPDSYRQWVQRQGW